MDGDEVSIDKGQRPQPQPSTASETPNQTPGAKYKRNIAINNDKLSNRYKGIQTLTDKNVSKRLEQVVRKTVRVATKVKDPKTFQQKYKTIYGKIFLYTPHTAWVQEFGKQPRLLRNNGFAFVPNPLIYGPCRHSRLSDYVAYKSARRSGVCLRFLDIQDPTAPQHAMFHEDENTGLAKKLTKKEQSSAQNSPTKRRVKPMGKRTGGRPCDKPRGMSLTFLEKITKPKGQTTETITHSDTESNKSSNSEEATETLQKESIKRKHHQQPRQRQKTSYHRDAPLDIVSQPWLKLSGTLSRSIR